MGINTNESLMCFAKSATRICPTKMVVVGECGYHEKPKAESRDMQSKSDVERMVSLRWSKKRPTEIGVYLFREKGASKKSVRLVVVFAWREWENSRKKKLSDLRGRFDIQEISYPLGSSFFDGEFAGPINVEEAN